jgi:signal transduction histidine kinase
LRPIRAAVARRYVGCMQAVWRAQAADPGTMLDAGVAAAGAALTAVSAWSGPPWLFVVLPVIMGAALALRRRAPLVTWAGAWAGAVLQTLVARQPPQGLDVLVLFAASYALGAYSGPRRSAAGLALSAPLVVLCAHDSSQLGELTGVPQIVGTARPGFGGIVLFVIEILACWMAGVMVRARRQAVSLAARNAALERQAAETVAAEHARIARELHDIVAHHISVMVLQAAAARASSRVADTALEKIERSGRQALTETRRLLGVLRDAGDDTGLAPQPGIGQLPALADSVRAAGLPVSLQLRGAHQSVPAAVAVSAYRIVQEALTNVLKHAGPAQAHVTVSVTSEAVTIDVTDNGAGSPPGETPAGGHGLTGMRERAAVFGGQLAAGPRPGGGFAVRAQLPLGDELPIGGPS